MILIGKPNASGIGQAEAPHAERAVGCRLRRRGGSEVRLGVGEAHGALFLWKQEKELS
jgi:hypothetical protein